MNRNARKDNAMDQPRLFAGIFTENYWASAAVIDPEGKTILSARYRYDFPQEDLPEIFDHLSHFADLRAATVRFAVADRTRAPLPLPPDEPLRRDILWVPYHQLDHVNLVRISHTPDTQHDWAKLLALLAALRFAQGSPPPEMSLQQQVA